MKIRQYTYPIVTEVRHNIMSNDGDSFGYDALAQTNIDRTCDMIERELCERALINTQHARPRRRIIGMSE